MHDTVNEIISFMATANKRFDDAFKGIQANHDLLLSLANSVQSTLSERLDRLQIFDTQKIFQSCGNLLLGIHDLIVTGYLPTLYHHL